MTNMEEEMISGWKRVHIPDSCRGVDIVVGIDEAGRGPVLGSLIYAAAFWPLSEHEAICGLKFDDSKQLSEEQRDGLFKGIRAHPSIGWVIEELSAEYISQEMQRVNPVSLNKISYDSVIKALETIRDATGKNGESPPFVKDVYVDTVGDPDYYKSVLKRALGDDFANFVIEKKADATYKVVSAASIVAKVSRDALLKEWVWKEPSINLDKNFGSGYPGDEKCVNWLKTAQIPVFGFPNLVRFSWSTTRECLIKGGACEIKWECDDESTGGSQSINNFFGAAGEKRPKRTSYFSNKKMKHVLPSDLKK